MNTQHEFMAYQITILVRTHLGGSESVKAFFDSVPFQYKMQDTLGSSLKEQLKAADVEFEEVIITMDAPAAKAKKVEKKNSLMGRLFGGE
ncbi:MAG: hypothetical protein H6632_18225 [Anaerolineales bacterium]|nr:hypothetical protein [Anaerolineales bacterium]